MEVARQKLFNKIFLALFGIVIFSNLLVSAYQWIGIEPLFFFTSDAVEIFLSGLIALILVYYIVKIENLWGKVIWVSAFLLMLLCLAYLKAYRRGISDIYYGFGEFLSFVGLTFLFVSLLYFFKNLRLFLNNHVVRTEKLLLEAEQRLVQQQFDPHFLYNMFNTLYGMSLQNHDKLSETILKLSKLMRYVTDHGSRKVVFLKDEVNFLQEFVSLQKIRFGEGARISIKIEGDLGGFTIAPFLLVTPVENAFKHGYYTSDEDSFVEVLISMLGSRLSLIVKNPIPESSPVKVEARKGTGLVQLKSRLKLTYPQNHHLDIKTEDNLFTFTLSINLHNEV